MPFSQLALNSIVLLKIGKDAQGGQLGVEVDEGFLVGGVELSEVTVITES